VTNGAPEVVELTAAQTHPLRRRVLRVGTASGAVAWEGDLLPGTRHLGIVSAGRVVAVSTWLRQPLPDPPTVPAVRLRGMATDPGRRGEGLGRLLLAAGCDRVLDDGFDLVWANARTSALDFYLAAGFVVAGEEFLDATTGLPHHRIRRRLGPRVPS
jgi:predicted GNAT family N-acyltransferase